VRNLVEARPLPVHVSVHASLQASVASPGNGAVYLEDAEVPGTPLLPERRLRPLVLPEA
jgi:hypothetical protein